MQNIIGKKVRVIIDRPLGSYHPKYPETFYPVNYGYIEESIAGDGEYQDAYILGVDRPIKLYEGYVIAIIHRYNDNEDKWVVVNEEVKLSKAEIIKQIIFQEKFFSFEVIM